MTRWQAEIQSHVEQVLHLVEEGRLDREILTALSTELFYRGFVDGQQVGRVMGGEATKKPVPASVRES